MAEIHICHCQPRVTLESCFERGKGGALSRKVSAESRNTSCLGKLRRKVRGPVLDAKAAYRKVSRQSRLRALEIDLG